MPRRVPNLANLVKNPDPLFLLIQPIFAPREINITSALVEGMRVVEEKIPEDPDVGKVDLRKLDVGFEAYPEKVVRAFLEFHEWKEEEITKEIAESLTRFIIETLLRFAQLTVLLKWKGKRKRITNAEFQEFLNAHPSFRGLEQQTLEAFLQQETDTRFSKN